MDEFKKNLMVGEMNRKLFQLMLKSELQALGKKTNKKFLFFWVGGEGGELLQFLKND